MEVRVQRLSLDKLSSRPWILALLTLALLALVVSRTTLG